MEIQVTHVAARTARADLKAGVLQVRMPRHWPRAEKEAAIARFQRWAIRRAERLSDLPPPAARPPLREGELWDMVRRVNAETLRVDVAGVRIGRARFSRLAQANWQSRILTFSRYAVNALPDRALRYLIIHELAHLRIPDHSARFWELVERHEPDWRYWRRVAQSHFVRAAEGAEIDRPARTLPVAAQRPDWRPDGEPGSRLLPLGGDPAANPRPADLRAAGLGPEPAAGTPDRALLDELTGPHGIQLPLFEELATEYPV